MNEAIYNEYLKFIAPFCDRCTFISDYLEKNGVDSSVIPLNGKKHILVNFSKSQYNGFFRIKNVIAHYDRVPESPGANDNSFAVFTMMEWAIKLSKQNIEHNVRLIFTDGEEISTAGKSCSDKSANGKESEKSSIVQEQGAYDLAGVFKRLGILNEEVYVFDCMGRGTVPILGKPPVLSKTTSTFKKRFNTLYRNAQTILEKAFPSGWVCLPVSLSDNAGFIAMGIPSVVFTMLPKEEASKYMFDLVNYPALEAFVTNRVVPKDVPPKELMKLFPVSWLLLHSKYDNESSVTMESFDVFTKILDTIADFKLVQNKN